MQESYSIDLDTNNEKWEVSSTQLFITDWIRWQEVLLLIIYNNHNKICDIFSFSKIKTQHIPTFFFLLEVKIKNLSSACKQCPISSA